MAFVVLHHKVGADPVEQMEDAGGIAVDQCGGHPNDPVRCGEDLRHGISLAAVVVVLVELIHDAAVQFSSVPALDVGTHGIAPAGTCGGVVATRVICNRPDLLQRRLMLRFRKMFRCVAAVDPAIGADLDPLAGMAGIDRRPEGRAASAASVVFAVFCTEEKLVDLAHVRYAILCEGRFNGLQTVRTEIRLLTPVPDYGGPFHIAVPGLLLGDDGVDALVAPLIQAVESVQFRVAAHHHTHGVRQGLGNLTRPLVCHMGGAQNRVERLLSAAAGLLCPQGVHSGHGGGANLRFAAAAFRHDDAAFVFLQLALHRLGHGKLRVVERIARVLLDVVVDGQDLRRERLAGRIKERPELPADAFGYRHAEGVQITGDILHAVKAVRVADGSGDGNGPAFQTVLHHGDDVGVVLPAMQHPGVQLLLQGNDLQPFQNAPAFQLIQHIVPERWNQRHRRFPVHLFKEAIPVVFRAEDDALARRPVRLFLGFIRLGVIFGSLYFLVIVQCQQHRLGVHTVVCDLPSVPLGLSF